VIRDRTAKTEADGTPRAGYLPGGYPPPPEYPSLVDEPVAAPPPAPPEEPAAGPATSGAGDANGTGGPGIFVPLPPLPPPQPTTPTGATAAVPSADAPHHAPVAVELRLLARAGSLGLVGQFASSLLAFGFSLAVSRLFKAQGSGVFFSALALFSILAAVGDLGADWGLNRMVPKLRAEGRVADVRRLLQVSLVPVLIWSIVLAVVLFAFAPQLASLVSHGRSTAEIARFVRILAPFLPVATLIPVLIAGTRGFDSVLPLVTIANIAVPAARLLLLPVLLGAGLGLVSVALAWALPLTLGALGILWSLLALAERYRRQRGSDPRSAPPTPVRDLARDFWRFTAPRSVAAAFAVIVLWLDVLLVGGLVSTREAGIYAVASRYMTIAGYASGAIGGTIAPQTARLITAGRMADLKHLYQRGTAWVMAMAWPVSIGTILFAPLLMRLFGRTFVTGSTALAILSIGMLVSTATGNNGVVLAMTGGSGFSLVIATVSVVVNVALNLALIPHFGINGSATAWTLTLVINNALGAGALWHRFRLHPLSRAYGEVALASFLCIGVLGAVCRVTLGASVKSLVLVSVIGGSAYVGFLWWRRRELGFDAFRRQSALA